MTARVIRLQTQRAARKPGHQPRPVDLSRFPHFRDRYLLRTRLGEAWLWLRDASALIVFLLACCAFWIGTPS